ncbi:MAG: DMT family transporter [Myxococcota bacterium]
MTRPNSNFWLGLSGLMLTVVGFSMTGIWVRWLSGMDPLAITAGRVSVALAVLLPVLFLNSAERERAPGFIRDSRVHWLAVRMTAFFLLAVIGFQLAPVALVVLFIGIGPAWILIFNRLAGEKTETHRAIGVLVALLGAALGLVPPVLAALGGELGARDVAIGAGLAVGSGFFSASYVFGRSRLAQRGVQPSGFLLASVTAFWGVFLFAVTPLTDAGAVLPSSAFQWLALAGLGTLSTAAPLWGLATASRLLPPLLVAFVGPVLPFTAALAAWSLLGEPPPVSFLWGAPFVVAGVGLVVWPRSRLSRATAKTAN